MSVLRSFESKIAGLVEGAFGRAFRSAVRPVELARKLAREMDEHRSVSVSRTYAPHEYAIYLSEPDRERIAGFEAALAEELAAYLLEHARREKLVLLARPHVEFRTDDGLSLGEFGIQARNVTAPEQPARDDRHGQTMVYSSAARVREPLAARPSRTSQALLLLDGRRLAVPPGGAVIGRSRECDVVLDDSNVSRRHAEVRPQGGGWSVRDLGSTNGVLVNGRLAEGAQELAPGDRLELGSTTLIFDLD